MKKITFLLFVFSLFSVVSYGQYLSEGFESTFPPTGWTITQVNPTETWFASAIPHTGTTSASVDYDPALVTQDENLTTPVMDLTAAVNPRIKFWFNMSYYWSIDPNNNYDFTVSATDGTTETVLWEESDYGVFTNFIWYEIELNLAAYVGQSNVQIIFNYTGSDGAALYIDDVVVDETPTCPAPTDLTVAGVTDVAANLGWLENGSSTNWDIEYGAQGFTPSGVPNVDDTTTNPYALSGLTPNSGYDFYVRSDCGMDNASDVSAWVGPISFSTLCDSSVIEEVPFSENFGGSVCGVITNEGAGAQQWSVVGVTSYGFTPNHLRYRWDSANEANSWYITQGINLTAGTSYTINYDYGGSGTTFPERLKVAYGVGQTSADMTTVLADYPNVVNNTPTTASIDFTPTVSGAHYFGFQAYSEADNFYLHLDNIAIDLTLGVDEFSKLSLFTYYPNPVENMLSLNAKQNIQNVVVYNMLGQEVLNSSPNSLKSDINMASLKSGAYFVKVMVADSSQTIRIIKN